VAALAGVPQDVIREARRKLAELETPARTLPAAPAGAEAPRQASLPFDRDPRADALVARLGALDADALSPRDALELLYELAATARGLC
jgi:DNA mismatch repair protein MutS